MLFTRDQVDFYEENGFLLIPEYFSPEEVEQMRGRLPGLFNDESHRRVLEKQTGVVRSVYGSHQVDELFGRLVRHPRMLEPAQQLLGSEVYVYQFKINAKKAFEGDVWEWHQDFVFWLKEDHLLQPRLVNMAIFLDEVNEFNGPLMVIPGSHKNGVVESRGDQAIPEGYEDHPEWISNLTADLKYTVGQESVQELVAASRIEAPKGPAGSLLLFHPNVVHGSVSNLSPNDRQIVLVTYNSVENKPAPHPDPRPEFIVSRDATPLQPLAEPALLAV